MHACIYCGKPAEYRPDPDYYGPDRNDYRCADDAADLAAIVRIADGPRD